MLLQEEILDLHCLHQSSSFVATYSKLGKEEEKRERGRPAAGGGGGGGGGGEGTADSGAEEILVYCS